MTRWNARDGFLRMGISFTFGSIYSTVVNARLDGPGRGFHRSPLADDSALAAGLRPRAFSGRRRWSSC